MSAFSRRQFLQTTSLAAGATLLSAAPFVHAASKTGNQNLMTGQGDYQFSVNHSWAKLPEQYSWQTTHGVTIDENGLLYIIHNGDAQLKDHPAVFVFDESGAFVRAFGSHFQGGCHGIDLRKEDGQEFLYITSNGPIKSITKITTTGEIVWEQFAPMESGAYPEGENTMPDRIRSGETPAEKLGGGNRFMPTNVALLPDGDFYLADGYGTNLVHRYSKDGHWKSAFGGPGKEPGQFSCCHGLSTISLPGKEDVLFVTDRSKNSVQVMSLDGQYQQRLVDFVQPCHFDTHHDLILVPELNGRVLLLDADYKPVSALCDNHEKIIADGKRNIRKDSAKWEDNKFVNPHDACFDHEGNIIVTEWVEGGRITKLTRIS